MVLLHLRRVNVKRASRVLVISAHRFLQRENRAKLYTVGGQLTPPPPPPDVDASFHQLWRAKNLATTLKLQRSELAARGQVRVNQGISIQFNPKTLLIKSQ